MQSAEQALAYVAKLAPGATVRIRGLRRGERFDMRAQVVERGKPPLRVSGLICTTICITRVPFLSYANSAINDTLARDALDARAKLLEFLLDALVATIDVVDALHLRRALGDQSRKHQAR